MESYEYIKKEHEDFIKRLIINSKHMKTTPIEDVIKIMQKIKEKRKE